MNLVSLGTGLGQVGAGSGDWTTAEGSGPCTPGFLRHAHGEQVGTELTAVVLQADAFPLQPADSRISPERQEEAIFAF